MSTQLSTLNSTIISAKQEFTEIAKTTKVDLSFEKECSFALQILNNPDNAFLAKTANANLTSLKAAITNIANIGLSLNPANKHAYLVPRGGKVCLDISYIGLINLAAKEGRIKFATASVVRENDDFTFNGKSEKVTHKFNPFDPKREKNPIIGAYCEAVLPDGSVIVEIMSRAEIEKARDCSGMKEKSIWNKWEEQMFCKTVVKRAAKFWVYGGSTNSLTANAIEYLNTEMEEGIAPKGANADTLSNALHGDITAETGEIETGKIIETEVVVEPKTPEDFIDELVEQHQLHDTLDFLLQNENVMKVSQLTDKKQRDLYKNLSNAVKKKVNSAKGEA